MGHIPDTFVLRNSELFYSCWISPGNYGDTSDLFNRLQAEVCDSKVWYFAERKKYKYQKTVNTMETLQH